MFLNNSYFNVLRKIDKSWEERQSKRRSSRGEKISFWKRSFSRSSSQTSKSAQTSFSSDESGLYSGDVNSGYYGDDEIDPCPKCQADTPVVGGSKAEIEGYDVISIQVNVREKKRSSLNLFRKTVNSVSVDDDEFVVIPSSREEFCSGNFRHSTPLSKAVDKKRDSQMLVTCVPKVVTSEPSPLEQCCCVTTPQKPIRFRLYAPSRSSSDTGVWWRENITWQLKQRNKTQTTNFAQLQNHRTHTLKQKVRINRELADYLNKYAEFRPHRDDLNTAFYEREPNAINKAEILQAIRSHSGIDKTTRLRANSVAHRAKTYMESQNQTKEPVKDTDEEDNVSIPPTRKRSKSMARSQFRGDRPIIPRWRESITSQLQMRNFLECKYFTDAIVRRTLSQLSISVSQSDYAKSAELLTDYDVITDDDVTTVVMKENSLNTSQSISQGYHSSPASAFIIRDLDAIHAKNERPISSMSFL